jgi:hypothetical protein
MKLSLKDLRFCLLVLWAFPALAQVTSGKTNDVHIDLKRNTPAKVKLPLIRWITPELEVTDASQDSIALSATIESATILKVVNLKVNQAGAEREMALLQTEFGGTYSVSKSIPLENGLNTIELVAENASQAKVSSSRFVYVRGAVKADGQPPATKTPIPSLFIKENSIVFADDGGNNILDASEEAAVKFILGNKGTREGKSLVLNYKVRGAADDIMVVPGTIVNLIPGAEAVVELRIKAGTALQTGTATLELAVMETDGFDSEPIEIAFETEAFKPPALTIVDALFTSVNGNTLSRNQPAQLEILIQNAGTGAAQNVQMKINAPDGVFSVGEKEIVIGDMKSGEARKMSYEFIVTTRYKEQEVPVTVELNEALLRYGASKTFTGIMDQPLAPKQLTVVGMETAGVITASYLRSPVDIDIPETGKAVAKRYALVIGNEDYSRYQTGLQFDQNVAFARNDANVVKDYMVKTLGVPKENITLLMDATRGRMGRELEVLIELGKLDSTSELIFYYAGHGLPDQASRKGYLIPVDVSASNLQDGISLSDLYSKLASSSASRVIIFLDACFSGGGRGEIGLLASRTVKVKPSGDLVDGNVVVFTASSGEEVSLPLARESHGLFTYHLLKMFKDSRGAFSLQELREYLDRQVPETSLRENKLKQTPQVIISPKVLEVWANWKF